VHILVSCLQLIFLNQIYIRFRLGVWATGITSTPFVNSLPLKQDRSKRILVNEHLQVTDPFYPNVFALGDCAVNEKNVLPPTAQAAEQSGAYVAKFLNAKAQG
jgi:NADH dehydrogenase FAD-containing subunit